MKKFDIKELAKDLVNDSVFKNTNVDNIICVVEGLSFCQDLDMIELRKYINIAQRSKKLIKINGKTH